MAIWTYLVAFGHFMSEWAIYGTARFWSPWAVPASLASGTLLWMILAWDMYVKAS